MIIEAIDTRCSSISIKRMKIRAISIVSGTIAPTMRPVRSPRKTITTNSTIASVSNRVRSTSLTE